MKKKRLFIDAPHWCRCKKDIKLRDGSGAQCGRRAVRDTRFSQDGRPIYTDLCWQHTPRGDRRDSQ